MRGWFALPEANSLLRKSQRGALLLASLIFLATTSVRLLHWQDLRPEIESGRMRFGMSDLYKGDAQNLLSGRFDLFIKGSNPPSDADIMTHPPGYSLLLALIFRLFGDSNAAWRLVQILMDALTAVAVFLIGREVLPTVAAFIAGGLIAVSPQIAHTSIVLLPDSPSVLPLVWAVLLIVRSSKSPNLFLTTAGALIGISCWLRPNALLLSPFLGLFIFLLFPRKRWMHAAAIVVGTLVVIAPITLRNIVVFHTFTPISLGVGHNLCTGIADYDDENRYGLLSKDHQVNEWEARIYNRPDYARSLYAPDGIARDRERLRRGLGVVKTHPVWFLSVMMRRIFFMMTFQHTPLISPLPTVTHSLAGTSHLEASWSLSPAEMLAGNPISPSNELTLDHQGLLVDSSAVEGRPVFVTQPIELKAGKDYVLQVPIDMLEGRIVVRITGVKSRALIASAAVPDALYRFPNEIPTNLLQIPLVSNGETVQVGINGTETNRVRLRLGTMQMFELGESAHMWTRMPRLMLRALQKFFTTATMLVLVSAGLALLIINSQWRPLAILLAVPVYYLLAQAPLHTEHRYVIAIHYFLLIPAAVTLYWAALKLWQVASKLIQRRAQK